MVLCFEIDRDTKTRLDELIRIGEYKDYSEVLSVSVANQYLLHASQQKAKQFETANDLKPANVTEPPMTPEAQHEDQPTIPSHNSSDIPPLFLLNSKSNQAIKVSPMPNDAFVTGAAVNVDRWIFGQHNKLLPAKANVRAILNIMAKNHGADGIPLDEAAQEIALAASQLGEHLRFLDARTQRSRDEAFAVAFPNTDPTNGDRSRLRYASQFVGSLSKDNRMSGLLIDFKFVNVDRHKPARIKLTNAGLEFAQLHNPILDSDNFSDRTPKFSPDESAFLVQHICDHLPVELFAFTAVLRAILKGSNTPDSLDAALKQYLPERKEKPFTDAFLTTQRAGVISRMADVGLVGRTRNGPNVTYVPTESGQRFLTRGSK